MAPKAVKCLKNFLTSIVALRDWIKLKTTNVIEKSFREVRRTGHVNCLNNVGSKERIVYAVLNHLKER